MSKTCVVDCRTRVAVIRDMDAAEEAQLAADRAEAVTRAASIDATRQQRVADLATVKLGVAAPGYADAVARLLGAT